MTSVVNIYRDAYDIYIGRPRGGRDPRMVQPGQYGFLGNPFPVAGDREASIAAFQQYFLTRVAEEPVFRAAVARCRGQRLACFCAPKSCHGDIIAAWLDDRLEHLPANPVAAHMPD